eukprot:SAG11_NODE_37275_length_257_cov_1.620253_1_plen_49_part_01
MKKKRKGLLACYTCCNGWSCCTLTASIIMIILLVALLGPLVTVFLNTGS